MTTLIVAIATLAVDQLTKLLASNGTIRAPWIEPTVNPDLALGVLGGPAFLELLAAAIGIGLAWRMLGNRVTGRAWAAATGLALGGAVGNLADRALSGAVRDFIVAPWLVFNVADVALLVGIAFCVLQWPVRPRPHAPQR